MLHRLHFNVNHENPEQNAKNNVSEAKIISFMMNVCHCGYHNNNSACELCTHGHSSKKPHADCHWETGNEQSQMSCLRLGENSVGCDNIVGLETQTASMGRKLELNRLARTKVGGGCGGRPLGVSRSGWKTRQTKSVQKKCLHQIQKACRRR